MTAHWYVCRTEPHREPVVIDQLRKEGFDTLWPTFIKKRKVRLREIDIERPLWPGYVMVKFCEISDAWQRIGAIRGSRGLLGFNGLKATPLPESETADLIERFGSGPLVVNVPIVPWHTGTKLRVKEGPLTGLMGEFVNLCLLPDGERVRALFTLLRRPTIVSLPVSHVEMA